MSKASRVNDLGASGVVSRKNIKEEEQSKKRFNLDEDESLRGTRIIAELIEL